MTTIISRLFEPAERARDAAASLRTAGFVAREFSALAPEHVTQDAGAETFIDDTAALPPLAAMTDTGISAEDAAIYRAAIEKGRRACYCSRAFRNSPHRDRDARRIQSGAGGCCTSRTLPEHRHL